MESFGFYLDFSDFYVAGLKEFCRATFCLYSVRRAMSVAVQRKEYCSSLIIFLYFNSKLCRRLPKICPWEKNLVKLPYSAKTTATESLMPFAIFCFDLQSCVNVRLVCKFMTALLTPEKRLKDSI